MSGGGNMAIKRIVIAPDSFKESMTAKQAATAIAQGFREVFQDAVDLELIPRADGGEGTMRSLGEPPNGTIYQPSLTEPLGDPPLEQTMLSRHQQTAIIEMAEASG